MAFSHLNGSKRKKPATIHPSIPFWEAKNSTARKSWPFERTESVNKCIWCDVWLRLHCFDGLLLLLCTVLVRSFSKKSRRMVWLMYTSLSYCRCLCLCACVWFVDLNCLFYLGAVHVCRLMPFCVSLHSFEFYALLILHISSIGVWCGVVRQLNIFSCIYVFFRFMCAAGWLTDLFVPFFTLARSSHLISLFTSFDCLVYLSSFIAPLPLLLTLVLPLARSRFPSIPAI